MHCFGANASEIVHIGQAIMSQPGERNTLKYFIETTFNYPTMAEALKIGAQAFYNSLVNQLAGWGIDFIMPREKSMSSSNAPLGNTPPNAKT